ncbi:GxxExxY protein [Candidatus Poribacteria bacterium]|nr:GxxExxY protein [Candidatus Poribacteria bacterium]
MSSKRMVDDFLHGDLTGKIIGSYYHVYNSMRHDLPEDFYQKAMEFDLEANEIHCECEQEFPVFYEEIVVGQQVLDAIVEQTAVLEYKVEHRLKPIREAQLLSYLKANGIEVGLLFNFGGKQPEFKRRVRTSAHHNVKMEIDLEKTIDGSWLHAELAREVLSAMCRIYRTLGPGFIFRIYQNSSRLELRKMGVSFDERESIEFYFRGKVIDVEQFWHFIVDEKLLLIPRATSVIEPVDLSTARDLLRRYNLQLGLLFNFQSVRPEPVFVRINSH